MEDVRWCGWEETKIVEKANGRFKKSELSTQETGDSRRWLQVQGRRSRLQGCASENETENAVWAGAVPHCQRVLHGRVRDS